MHTYIKVIILIIFAVILPCNLKAHTIITEGFVEGSDYYVGNVFGKQNTAEHTNIHLESFFIMKTAVTYSLHQQVSVWANNNSYLISNGCNGIQYEDCFTPETDGGLHPVTNLE